MSSKLSLILNILTILLFVAVIVMQLLESQAYTGSLIGIFQ